MRKFEPIFSKIKSVATGNLWTKTNGIFVFIFGCIAVAADALEIKDKLFSEASNEEQIITEDSVQKPETILDSVYYASKTKNTRSSNTPKTTIKNSKKQPKIAFFNESEFLLGNTEMAVFIKNENSGLDQEFQQRLSNDFLNKNINASSSFFDVNSLPHFNKFYTANANFLKTTNIDNHTRKYLIGTVEHIKSKSTLDKEITIIDLSFHGKFVNLETNSSKVITKKVRETNYQEFKALQDALKRLSEEIVKTF